jgi:hypothetical protein
MVRLAPVFRLAPALELHRLDVGSADDEMAFDELRRSARNFVAMAAMELTMRFMVLVLSVH